MKNILTVSFLLIVCLSINKTNAQESKFDYPIKPNSEDWKNLKTTQEKIDACQIPEKVLNNISTFDLLKLCMNYPLLNNYTASNNPSEGLTNIITGFNGLKEFLKRKDSYTVLLEYYKNERIEKIDTCLNKGKYTFDLCALELLFCQIEIINSLNTTQKKEFLAVLLSKYDDKFKFKEYFGIFGKMTTAFVGIKYLNSIDSSTTNTNEMQRFSNKMIVSDFKLLDEVIENINKFLLK